MRIYTTTNIVVGGSLNLGTYSLQVPEHNTYDYVDVFYTKEQLEAVSKLHTSSQSLLKALVDTYLASQRENAYKSFVEGLLKCVKE